MRAPRLGKLFGSGDITGLRSFVPAGQQHYQEVAALLEINPVSRSVVNPQFAYAFTYRLYVARQTFSQAHQSGCDDGSGSFVLEACLPPCKGRRLLELEHVSICSQ
ncbi:conserved hypothetical protein [Hyphomicrobiales bacterium]|nr:conserved hypothetical protein [Hyphomicrobiales bacterium]CAH1688032.1 conserved hypothetical protein [Hyphomicrobiales bacterium]